VGNPARRGFITYAEEKVQGHKKGQKHNNLRSNNPPPRRRNADCPM